MTVCSWGDSTRFLGTCPTDDGAAGYEGYVGTMADAFRLIQDYQNATNTSFVMVKQKKSASELEKHKVFWEEPKKAKCKGPILDYDGIPFVIRSSYMLDCQYGRDRHAARKRQFIREHVDKVQTISRKINCTAAIFIREICRFPQFELTIDTPKRRFCAAKKLREAMTDPSAVVMETRVYVRLPREDAHVNHSVGEDAGMDLPVDRQVKEFVRQQIISGTKNISKLESLTQNYVEELFCGKSLPSRNNRRFFPTRRDYSNLMYRVRSSSNGGCIRSDQSETTVQDTTQVTVPSYDENQTLESMDVGISTADRCRDVLYELVDLTYRCTDAVHLEALEERLRVAHSEFLACNSMEFFASSQQVPMVARWESVQEPVVIVKSLKVNESHFKEDDDDDDETTTRSFNSEEILNLCDDVILEIVKME